MRGMRFSLVVAVFATMLPLAFAAPAPATPSSQGSGCIARRPAYVEDVFESNYTAGCSGHDEPELDPISDLPGSGRDLTWTVVLPSNGSVPVDAVGPTFWFGGTVTDPNSLFGQAFVELQFYPNAVVTNCTPNGGFELKHVVGSYSVCSPVWSLTQTGTKGVFHEPAAFNAMLTDGTGPTNPLVMQQGDTVTVHWFTTSAADGYHVTVTDTTTGGSGTIVLDAKKDGPLMPAFDVQAPHQPLAWGIVDDTPNSFVWEIGHTSDFSSPHANFCLPGDTTCDSYNAESWAGALPIQIKSVQFADGSLAQHWQVVSDFGGKDEINQNCGAANYGNPFCIYPWFSLGSSGLHYGVDFPDNVNDFGQADQFQQKTDCDGPFGTDTTYCSTPIQ